MGCFVNLLLDCLSALTAIDRKEKGGCNGLVDETESAGRSAGTNISARACTAFAQAGRRTPRAHTQTRAHTFTHTQLLPWHEQAPYPGQMELGGS